MHKYSYLALLLFLWAGLSNSYSQVDTLKEKYECIKIINKSKSGHFGKTKSKISDSDVVFLIFDTSKGKTFCSFYLKSEPNVTFEYLIDNIKKEIESGMVEDLR